MKSLLRILTLVSALFVVSPAFAVCTGQFLGGTVCGNNTTSQGVPGPTANPVLGVPGTNVGTLGFAGASSGTATITPQAVAGTPTLTLPTTTGTFADSASTPLVLNATTGVLTCPSCLTSTGSFANPTATVGFTAVNGSATTAMRSDAAPPLNASIYSTSSIATTLVERDANQNTFANAFVGNETSTVSAGTTTVLTVASARQQVLTGTTTQIYQLPNATTLTVGDTYTINNNSTGAATVTNAGGSTLYTIPAGGFTEFIVIVNGTSNGTWDWHSRTPQSVTWGMASLQLGIPGASTNILVFANATSGTITITPPTGALGSVTQTLPTASGTYADGASSPLALNSTTGNLTCATCVTSSGGGAITGTSPIVVSAAGVVSLQGNSGTVAVGSGGTGSSFTATPSLGTAGSVVGTLSFANATSGSITLSPPTGALGSVTATLPANTGTLAETNLAQTWTAAQTFNNSDILLLGSSTGATTFTSANAGASNFTLTFPAVTDQLVARTTTDTLTNKTLTTPTINGAAISGTFTGNATLSGNITFSGQLIETGTTVPTLAAGQTLLSGTTTPPVSGLNNGNALFFNTAVVGAAIQGQGSSYDVALFNSTGNDALGVVTGTANIVMFGTITAASLSTVGTIAGSLCQTSAGLFLYKSGVNCFTSGAATSLAPGTTTISPSTSGAKLYDNAGIVGEQTTSVVVQTFTTLKSTTVSITSASPAVVTWTNSLSAGQWIEFTSGTLPTGLSLSTPYCVIAAGLSTSSFEIALTCGGSAINTTGSAGSGITGLMAYVPTSGMQHAWLRCLAGGGAGGGGTSGSTTQGAGGGGGEGSYSEANVTAATVGASQLVTLTAAGQGSSGANGGNAGNISVGSICTANGGAGGTVGTGSGPSAGAGGFGGTVGTGNVLAVAGNGGGTGFASSLTTGAIGGSGTGGASILGGAASGVGATVSGVNAGGYGGGGSGGYSYAGTSTTGGNGAPPIVIITEYVNI